ECSGAWTADKAELIPAAVSFPFDGGGRLAKYASFGLQGAPIMVHSGLSSIFMNLDSLYSELTLKTDKKLVLLVMDGLGDLATRESNYLTPLEAARTPHLDALTRDAVQGRMTPVAPGITPGSGPGHLALFGYDPIEFQVGRGVIEALGLGVELKAGDVAARANFCTLDDKGIVTDRRAGRIETSVCEELRSEEHTSELQ